MRRFLFTFCILAPSLCFAQSASPFRQFFFNPYLYNPGFTGINGTTEIYVAYRKQWINFNDGPTTMGVNLQYPTHKKVALGLNIISDETVALRNSTALATFAYVLPIADEQTLRFGISGGVGMNDLHLEEGEFDPNDPTIAKASQNNAYMDGNFGAVYTYKGLRIGFSLPHIFEGNQFSASDYNKVTVSSNSLGNRFYSASYRFQLGAGNIALEPYVLFNQRADKQNNWEAATLVHFKDKIWGGAAYHETNGLAFFLGMNVKNLFRFSYSYELPPVDKNFVNTSSHEIQLGLRLGKKRDPILTKKAANAQQQTLAQEEPSESNVKEETVEEAVTDPASATNGRNTAQNAAVVNSTNNADREAIADNTNETTTATPGKETAATTTATSIAPSETGKSEVKSTRKTSKPPMSFTLASGHYVVVGAFKIMDNALKYSMDLQRKGQGAPMVAISPKNSLYYVYIFSTYDIEEARRERNQYRLRRPFSEAWVLTID